MPSSGVHRTIPLHVSIFMDFHSVWQNIRIILTSEAGAQAERLPDRRSQQSRRIATLKSGQHLLLVHSRLSEMWWIASSEKRRGVSLQPAAHLSQRRKFQCCAEEAGEDGENKGRAWPEKNQQPQQPLGSSPALCESELNFTRLNVLRPRTPASLTMSLLCLAFRTARSTSFLCVLTSVCRLR